MNPPLAEPLPVKAKLVKPPPSPDVELVKPGDPVIEIQQLRDQHRRLKGRFIAVCVAFVFLLAVSVLQFVGTFVTCQILFAARRDSERAQRQTIELTEKLADARNSLTQAAQNLFNARQTVGQLDQIQATVQRLDAQAARLANRGDSDEKRLGLLADAEALHRDAEVHFGDAVEIMKKRLTETDRLLGQMYELRSQQEQQAQPLMDPNHKHPAACPVEQWPKAPVRTAVQIAAIRASLKSDVLADQLDAVSALADLGPLAASATPDVILRLQQSPEHMVRVAAARCLGSFRERGKPAVPALIEAMKNDTSWLVRREAAVALTQMGPDVAKVAVPAIKEAMTRETDDFTRRAFDAAIKDVESQAPPAEGAVSFEKHVLPIFQAKCGQCHIQMNKGKLSLKSLADVLDGGESGPGVVPGNLKESVVWQELSDRTMPPKGQPQLTAAEIDIIKRWIATRE